MATTDTCAHRGDFVFVVVPWWCFDAGGDGIEGAVANFAGAAGILVAEQGAEVRVKKKKKKEAEVRSTGKGCAEGRRPFAGGERSEAVRGGEAPLSLQ